MGKPAEFTIDTKKAGVAPLDVKVNNRPINSYDENYTWLRSYTEICLGAYSVQMREHSVCTTSDIGKNTFGFTSGTIRIFSKGVSASSGYSSSPISDNYYFIFIIFVLFKPTTSIVSEHVTDFRALDTPKNAYPIYLDENHI